MKQLKTLSSFEIILALHSAIKEPSLSERVRNPWKQLIEVHEKRRNQQIDRACFAGTKINDRSLRSLQGTELSVVAVSCLLGLF